METRVETVRQALIIAGIGIVFHAISRHIHFNIVK